MFRPSALIVLALCALTIQICSGNEGFPEFKVLTPNELKKEFANPNCKKVCPSFSHLASGG